MTSLLSPERGLIFRITHVRNLDWILDNGLHCANSAQQDPGFVRIGNEDLITKRPERQVDVQPHGTLADYIPFYFTPWSPMLYNILTGHRQTPKVSPDDIVFLVTALPHLAQHTQTFVFSDRHAFLAHARFTSDLDQLAHFVPWEQLQQRDFRRDPARPDLIERYQAEALIWRHLPAALLRGIVCHKQEQVADIKRRATAADLNIHIDARPVWYFS